MTDPTNLMTSRIRPRSELDTYDHLKCLHSPIRFPRIRPSVTYSDAVSQYLHNMMYPICIKHLHVGRYRAEIRQLPTTALVLEQKTRP